MPVIHTHVSVSTTPEQREALKAAYGRAITAVPGKSEGWLMCPFEDNMPIYFGGSDDQPAAYVEVNVFGRSVPSSAWEKLTQDIMAALNSTLVVPEDRIRAAMENASSYEELVEGLELALGQAWDDELESFRHAGAGAPVRWLNNRVG